MLTLKFRSKYLKGFQWSKINVLTTRSPKLKLFVTRGSTIVQDKNGDLDHAEVPSVCHHWMWWFHERITPYNNINYIVTAWITDHLYVTLPHSLQCFQPTLRTYIYLRQSWYTSLHDKRARHATSTIYLQNKANLVIACSRGITWMY